MHCPVSVRAVHVVSVQEIVSFSGFLSNSLMIDRGMFNYSSVIRDWLFFFSQAYDSVLYYFVLQILTPSCSVYITRIYYGF